MTVPVIELDNVSMEFKARGSLLKRQRQGIVHAVNSVSLTVDQGEIVGLVGESGSGKSTVGRLATRLLQPTRGRVLLDGADISHSRERHLRAVRKSVQMVFQDPYSSFDPRSSLAASLEEPLRVHSRLSASERHEHVSAMIRRVGLEPSAGDRLPREFSGGQLQRLALARALMLEPKAIVADEALSSLDVSTQAQIVELLRDLGSEYELSILFISHDISMVRHLASKVAVMFRGVIVEYGPTADVLGDPQHPYTRELLDVVPVPDPVIQRSRHRVATNATTRRDLGLVAGGCAFSARCAHATDRCRESEPATHRRGTSLVHCHLLDPENVGRADPTGLAQVAN